MIELNNIHYSIRDSKILNDISLRFVPNQFNVILGPNGAGKTTLLKIATGIMSPTKGTVTLENKNIAGFTGAALAIKRSVLSQQYDIAFPLSVHEVVMMGRYPHFHSFPSKTDKDIVQAALQLVNISHKMNQVYQTLSGGEKQKVHMARVLAQIWNVNDDREAKYLFLDEPTTNLDIRFQLQLLDIAKSLLPLNTTVIAILHDLNLSFQYGDAFYFLEQGQLIHHTTQKQDIKESLVEQLFEVKAVKWQRSNQHDLWEFYNK